jgi:hypothetical protein
MCLESLIIFKAQMAFIYLKEKALFEAQAFS